jgi:hypothetical protein
MDMRMPARLDPESDDTVEQWSEKYVDIESDIPRSKIRLLEWWYSWTAPPIPPTSGQLEQREAARRGRLSSTILLILIGIIFCLALPVAILQQLFGVMMLLAIGLVVLSIALFLNRRGKISSAAWILIINIDVGLWASILTSPGPAGLTANSVPLYDLLVISELLGVSLLPPRSVFIIALCNSAFVITSLNLWNHAASLNNLLATAGPEVYARPIALQFIVAFVTYLWVRSATQAIARADRAEVIAALEHQMAKQEHTIALQKRQLDHSINQIVETLMHVANGDFNARVPLTQDNVLWQVAGSLNNLLSRLQRLRQIENEVAKLRPYIQRTVQLEHELERVRYEARHLAEALHQAKITRRLTRLTRTGTLLDPVIAELNGSALLQSPAFERNKLAQENAFSSRPDLPRTTLPLFPERNANDPGKQSY